MTDLKTYEVNFWIATQLKLLAMTMLVGFYTKTFYTVIASSFSCVAIQFELVMDIKNLSLLIWTITRMTIYNKFY